MVRRRFHGGAHLAGDDIALGQVLDIVDHQPETRRRQALYRFRQAGHHQVPHHAGLQGDPKKHPQQGRQPTPDRGIEAVVRGQRMQRLDLAGTAHQFQ